LILILPVSGGVRSGNIVCVENISRLIPVLGGFEGKENWLIVLTDPGAEIFSKGSGEIPGGVGRWLLIEGDTDG
jgi:hypothetical protein